jgi:hypothetical protein
MQREVTLRKDARDTEQPTQEIRWPDRMLLTVHRNLLSRCSRLISASQEAEPEDMIAMEPELWQ